MADVKGPIGPSSPALSNTTQGDDSPTVRVGEGSLADVARRLNVNLEALAQANPQIKERNALKPGQEIRRPQGEQAAAAAAFEQAAPAAAPALPLADPLAKSLIETRFNRENPAGPTLPPGIMMYAKDAPSGPGGAPANTGPSVAADITSLLAEGAKVKEAKEEFTGAQKAIAAGDYAKAYEHLEKLMRKQGEEVLSDDMVAGTQTVRDQLEFLAGMQKKGIKADYPPTEQQLVDYFSKLKDDPAAARKALGEYGVLFHVHPGNTNRSADIQYSKDDNRYGTRAPDSWSEVANRPSGDKGKHVGKQLNDCEGYAFMADKLLKAAGFNVKNHITAFPGPNGEGHSMVSFTHPKDKGRVTLASNHVVVLEATEKAAAKAGLKSVMSEATGKENFYIGRTMVESQIQQVKEEKQL